MVDKKDFAKALLWKLKLSLLAYPLLLHRSILMDWRRHHHCFMQMWIRFAFVPSWTIFLCLYIVYVCAIINYEKQLNRGKRWLLCVQQRHLNSSRVGNLINFIFRNWIITQTYIGSTRGTQNDRVGGDYTEMAYIVPCRIFRGSLLEQILGLI